MKYPIVYGTLTCVLCLLLSIVLGGQAREDDEDGAVYATAEKTLSTEPAEPPVTQLTEPDEPSVTAPEVASFDRRFRIPVLKDGEVVSMELRLYVLGALLGEMPTSFADEALKAQAVACRTYALRCYGSRKHDPAAVCTDSGCCMKWCDPEAYADKNGADALRRAEAAVDATDGIAVFYGDALIDATFFSCSGGRTETAEAVWGRDVPYLQAVESPDEHAPYDVDSVSITDAEFVRILTEANEMAVFPDDRTKWIGSAELSPGNGIATLELGGCIYTGTQLRKLFHLRSTAFSLDLTDEGVVFTTRGFGHRVGMSQYGANAMAQAGADYRQILQWYYSGVAVRSVADTGD